MAILEIPTFKKPFYTERVIIERVAYTLTFRFNSRMQAWTVDVANKNNVTILAGIPIVEYFSLTYKFAGRIPGLFPGTLVCYDMTKRHREPGADLIGGDCRLFYIESA